MNGPSEFNAAARPKKKRPSPLSLRLTDEERALLQDLAGGRSMNAYIREKVFGEAASPRRSYRKPRPDEAAIANALALLGQSRLSSNLNQLAKAANIGALPVSPEVEDELSAACADIRTMRDQLVAALGVQSRG